jgi:hypothetical protein
MPWCANKEEATAIRQFATFHWNKCAKPLGDNVPIDTYRVVMYPTGVGTAIEVECLICGEKRNVTDYSAW